MAFPLASRRQFLCLMGGGLAASAARANAPLSAPRPAARPGGLSAYPPLGNVIERAGLGGKTACLVADATTGEVLEAHRPLLAQPPASVAKAITALYALDTLGPAFRFTTRLRYTGTLDGGRITGDLILEGSGDPLLDTDRLAAMASDLRAAGVFEVAGQFRVAASALPAIPSIDPQQPDHVGYNPTISGLNLNFNRVFFEWKRNSGEYAVTLDARARKYRPQVTVSRMRVVDRALPIYTYASGSKTDEWTVARAALGREGGRWLPVRRPAEYAAEVMATLLRANGITTQPGPPAPLGTGTVLVEHTGPQLTTLAKSMLKYSTNLTAETLGLTASLARRERLGSLADSGSEMATWLKSDLGARRPAFVDHSGLGDASRITPGDMVTALSKAGANGALRPLLKGIVLKDGNGKALASQPAEVVAKTGTLNFVSGLGGYIRTERGRDLAFAIFSSDLPRRAALTRAERERPEGGKAWARRARKLQNGLLLRWARSLDA